PSNPTARYPHPGYESANRCIRSRNGNRSRSLLPPARARPVESRRPRGGYPRERRRIGHDRDSLAVCLRDMPEAGCPSGDRVTRTVYPAEREAHDLDAVDPRVELLPLPAVETIPHEGDVEAERVADVDERVGPVDVVGIDPFLDLGQQPLTRPIARIHVLL